MAAKPRDCLATEALAGVTSTEEALTWEVWTENKLIIIIILILDEVMQTTSMIEDMATM